MGLDMYLNRSIKIEGWDNEDYSKAANALSEEVATKFEGWVLREEQKDQVATWLENSDLETLLGQKGANRLKATTAFKKLEGPRGVAYFFNVREEVGYWRKANAIHQWFVENVQGGEDDCSAYFVSEDDLKELLRLTKLALVAYEAGEFDVCSELLPPTSGFFFGSTEIDEYYKEDLETTIKTLEEVLDTTNFNEQQIFYRASW